MYNTNGIMIRKVGEMRMLRKKIIVLFILVQLFVVISITSIGESDNWPTFSHDVERTGFST